METLITCLNEMVLMRGHNKCSEGVIWKNIPNYTFQPFLSGALISEQRRFKPVHESVM